MPAEVKLFPTPQGARLVPPAPGDPESDVPPPGMVAAKDVINDFSQRLAGQIVILCNAGMPLDTIITMFMDHAAALIAQYEPSATRAVRLGQAREQLWSFTKKKVLQRKAKDQKTGSKGYRGK